MEAKFALCDWSLHRQFESQRFSLSEYLKIASEVFGLEAVEVSSRLISLSKKENINDLIEGSGVQIVNINVDEGNIIQEYEYDRRNDLDMIKEWIKIAERIGSPHIRVEMGGDRFSTHLDDETLERCVKSYEELSSCAEKAGVSIRIENHMGLSANPNNVIRVVKSVKSKYLGTCPDFGNLFRTWKLPPDTPYDVRYEGLRKMIDYAIGIHVKTYEFRPDGMEKNYDLRRCVDMAKSAGFRDFWGIEFSGTRVYSDEYDGIAKTIQVLNRLL